MDDRKMTTICKRCGEEHVEVACKPPLTVKKAAAIVFEGLVDTLIIAVADLETLKQTTDYELERQNAIACQAEAMQLIKNFKATIAKLRAEEKLIVGYGVSPAAAEKLIVKGVK